MAYVTRRRPKASAPRLDDDYEMVEFDRLLPFVVECDGPRDTGLLDQHGDPIFEVPDPIGFRFSENE